MKEFLFISWAPHSSRSDAFAHHFNGRSIMFYSKFLSRNKLLIPIKYLVLTICTLYVLLRCRPKYIIVMVPPIIACIPVWLYCVFSGSKYAIDAHTAAILMKRWKRILFIRQFFSKRAAVTIVTNSHLEKEIVQKDVSTMIIRDIPIIFPDSKSKILKYKSNIMVVCSFHSDDEPILEIMIAASYHASTQFHISGDSKKLSNKIIQNKPSNVHFTGFLSRQEYSGYMRSVELVMAITNRDHTMQRGAYEAIYMGKPVITSNFPLLVDSFSKGAVHVNPDAHSIEVGIRKALNNIDVLTDQAIELRNDKIKIWKTKQIELSNILMD